MLSNVALWTGVADIEHTLCQLFLLTSAAVKSTLSTHSNDFFVPCASFIILDLVHGHSASTSQPVLRDYPPPFPLFMVFILLGKVMSYSNGN